MYYWEVFAQFLIPGIDLIITYILRKLEKLEGHLIGPNSLFSPAGIRRRNNVYGRRYNVIQRYSDVVCRLG